MLKHPPCKDCDNKGCGSYHDICKEYLSWKAERKEVTEKARQEELADITVKGYLVEKALYFKKRYKE